MTRTSRAHGTPRPLEGGESAIVMIVDDEPTTIDVLEVLLQGEGYTRLVTTTEPRGALDLLARTLPDVLLLNLQMPELGGLEILGAMRQAPELAQIPVIILTSSTDSETKLAALELGAHDFLGKPVDPSELALRLRNTLALRALRERPERARHGEALEPAAAPPPGAAASRARLRASAATARPVQRATRTGPPLVSRLAGKSPRLRAIAEKFVGRLDEKILAMEASRLAGDFDDLVELAHWLKGAAGTVGFDAFTGPAEALKLLAKERRALEVEASIREICALAARIAPPDGQP